LKVGCPNFLNSFYNRLGWKSLPHALRVIAFLFVRVAILLSGINLFCAVSETKWLLEQKENFDVKRMWQAFVAKSNMK
jgi:hypothetical protein